MTGSCTKENYSHELEFAWFACRRALKLKEPGIDVGIGVEKCLKVSCDMPMDSLLRQSMYRFT
jgi:hypothetical protein